MRIPLGLTILGLGLITGVADAQFEIKVLGQSQTPEQLAQKLVGGGVVITNVQFTGSADAAGFVCAGSNIIGVNSSVLLTSGLATNVVGPNSIPDAGTDNGLAGDADLAAEIGEPTANTFDATVLEFDFIPAGDQVHFNYVFASEEYNEFVNLIFNDAFAFFINGVNYALIPGTATPVSVNNVNNGYGNAGEPGAGPCNNCQYYVDNSGATPPYDTQMDGFTKVLTVTAPVTAGAINHMKLVICDVSDGIYDSAVFIQAGSLSSIVTSTNCVTRNSRFWFTHPFPVTPDCVSLFDAIQLAINTLGCDTLNLGFMELPVGYRNDDNVRDAYDATIEALGMYWRSSNKTGELGGTQNEKYRAAKLCKERKRLAVEYISAFANATILKTDPSSCGDYPSNLLDQALSTLAGDDVVATRAMTTLLRRFNSSGLAQNLPAGLVECSAMSKRDLKQLSRDPTSRFSCPGIGDNCAAAVPILFPAPSIFSQARFKGKASLTRYPSREAYWVISPSVGVTNRTFTADTFGSNFNTLLTVFTGSCSTTISNGVETIDARGLTEVTSNDDANSTQQSKASFVTDGTATYFIRVSGSGGAIGSARLTVTSP